MLNKELANAAVASTFINNLKNNSLLAFRDLDVYFTRLPTMDVLTQKLVVIVLFLEVYKGITYSCICIM